MVSEIIPKIPHITEAEKQDEGRESFTFFEVALLPIYVLSITWE